MKLKKKPEYPVRSTTTKVINFDNYDSLSELIAVIPAGIDPRINHGYYDSGARLEYEELEREEDFAKRVDVYERNLAKYNEWFEANKEEIEKYLNFQKAKKEDFKSKQKESLKEEIVRLKKKLKGLE